MAATYYLKTKLRTLCRALRVANRNPCGNVTRSLYEAFSLSFLTELDQVSFILTGPIELVSNKQCAIDLLSIMKIQLFMKDYEV